jgi:hypothetical protein
MNGIAIALLLASTSAPEPGPAAVRVPWRDAVAVPLVSSEDRGCCVLKPNAIKTSWQYSDDEFRRECARAARAADIDFDFYKGKSCADVK